MVKRKTEEPDFLKYASDMVKTQIQTRGINNPELLDIIKKIPRHLFVRGFDFHQVYGDYPLPIGCSQTISQPYIVAYMTELLCLSGNEKVLEIGTGSGYQTSILAKMAKSVYTIEKIQMLYERAHKLLTNLEYTNIYYLNGDGSAGWLENAPYDRIIVTAALPAVPDVLKDQLAEAGILVAPVGNYQTYQTLLKISRHGKQFTTREDIQCRFVPVIGEYGF